MDIFRKAKSVRLTSYKDKCLIAEEDRETVIQSDSERSSEKAVWTVELVEGKDFIRLKSCFGTYLTASSTPFLPGVTGKRVVQTAPYYCDPTTEWEPLRDGMQVRLRSFWGNFLRPNGGLPPWRNSVTHDIPHRPNTRNKLLWDIEVVEKRQPVQVDHMMAQPAGDGIKLSRLRSRSFSSSMSCQNKQIFMMYQEFI